MVNVSFYQAYVRTVFLAGRRKFVLCVLCSTWHILPASLRRKATARAVTTAGQTDTVLLRCPAHDPP